MQPEEECLGGNSSGVGGIRKDLGGFMSWEWVGTRERAGSSGRLAFIIQVPFI